MTTTDDRVEITPELLEGYANAAAAAIEVGVRVIGIRPETAWALVARIRGLESACLSHDIYITDLALKLSEYEGRIRELESELARIDAALVEEQELGEFDPFAARPS